MHQRQVQLRAAQQVLGHLEADDGLRGQQAAVLGHQQPVVLPQLVAVDGGGQAVGLVTVAHQLAEGVEHQRAQEALHAVEEMQMQPLVGEDTLTEQALQDTGRTPRLHTPGGGGDGVKGWVDLQGFDFSRETIISNLEFCFFVVQDIVHVRFVKER